ncbi:MAG: hypothetical protein N2109_08070 [Fimbriimonadales bacterium]|nr:hypothetical protein [Fimbriimonadales bacterium]
MVTPFDWQESIGHRSQYVENKLAHGLPVVAASVAEGVLLVAWRRNARKVFEIYDRLAMAAIGQQSDVEALRTAAVEFAHREGYSRSESDVTIERVAGALSQPVKRAFGDLTVAPFVVRALFAQVGSAPKDDRLVVLGFDGDYGYREGFAALAGDAETEEALIRRMEERDWSSAAPSEALGALRSLWEPGEKQASGVRVEAALLRRTDDTDRRLQPLD